MDVTLAATNKQMAFVYLHEFSVFVARRYFQVPVAVALQSKWSKILQWKTVNDDSNLAFYMPEIGSSTFSSDLFILFIVLVVNVSAMKIRGPLS